MTSTWADNSDKCQLLTCVMYSCGAKLKSGRFDVKAIPGFSDFHTYVQNIVQVRRLVSQG